MLLGDILTTGSVFGVLHMISGIDHIGALVVFLSIIDWRVSKIATCWACGHSIGVAIIAWLQECFNRPDLMLAQNICNFVAGLALIFLGLSAITFLWTLHQMHSDSQSVTIRDAEEDLEAENSLLVPSDESKKIDDNVSKRPVFGPSFQLNIAMKQCGCWRSILLKQRNQTLCRFSVWFFGVVQGCADSFGLLGALPSMILANRYYSAIYITTFCISGMLMAIVAGTLYGKLVLRDRKRYEHRDCRIELFAALLSACMGLRFLIESIVYFVDRAI
uniref:Uncharacterized protein AlNc14C19G2027 n=1 Tax=Albugo laibachii Nc14 TaxID=890382 RepID=F0W556_9STRA|nr:conserved hypothetical protein [Albugo laibachii Nc14]|eukprot:CCA16247.1 conserved hypothetical protein [Albugo laibachii Nc14]